MSVVFPVSLESGKYTSAPHLSADASFGDGIVAGLKKRKQFSVASAFLNCMETIATKCTNNANIFVPVLMESVVFSWRDNADAFFSLAKRLPARLFLTS